MMTYTPVLQQPYNSMFMRSLPSLDTDKYYTEHSKAFTEAKNHLAYTGFKPRTTRLTLDLILIEHFHPCLAPQKVLVLSFFRVLSRILQNYNAVPLHSHV
uniref:Uncharacterized protein n=1 Tax=Cacopsylla melanoneura TaxID=428564 RepID=A0A8D8TI27_9HEMI